MPKIKAFENGDISKEEIYKNINPRCFAFPLAPWPQITNNDNDMKFGARGPGEKHFIIN